MKQSRDLLLYAIAQAWKGDKGELKTPLKSEGPSSLADLAEKLESLENRLCKLEARSRF